MEENVALDTAKQKKFVKSIKGIKKLIKKNENEKPAVDENVKTKDEKPKRKRPERGLVYLSHIPHGFYEHQMTQYFKQFGVVTNTRVIRSKRTGNSKGCAFIEFKEPAVGEIVAETMNNYLMGKRLIKAAYVPPEKQRPKAFRKHWSRFSNPGRDAKLKMKKSYNENKDEQGDLKRARKILSNLNKTKKKLSEMGINYDFFTPVDVPEALQDSLKQNEKGEDSKLKKDKKQKEEIKTNLVKIDKNVKENKKTVKIEKSKTVKSEETKPIKKVKKNETVPVVNKKEQKQKQQKLKEAGVKPPENFLKVEENSENSDDSSIEFDSDEYEKMLDDDSDADSNESDEGDDDGGSEDDDDESEDIDDSDDEEIVPPKKSKGPIIAIPQPKKQGKQKGNAPQQVKRKEPAKTPVVSKKPKFEKQTQQPMKKQFKKKK